MVSSGGAAAWAAQRIVTVRAALDEALGHLLEVALGTAALGVAGVAPAEECDVPAARSQLVSDIAGTRYYQQGRVSACRV